MDIEQAFVRQHLGEKAANTLVKKLLLKYDVTQSPKHSVFLWRFQMVTCSTITWRPFPAFVVRVNAIRKGPMYLYPPFLHQGPPGGAVALMSEPEAMAAMERLIWIGLATALIWPVDSSPALCYGVLSDFLGVSDEKTPSQTTIATPPRSFHTEISRSDFR